MTVALDMRETSLEDVVERATGGDHVHVMRDGQAVARVLPIEDSNALTEPTAAQVRRARAAMEDIAALRQELKLKFDLEEFKAERDFGRR